MKKVTISQLKPKLNYIKKNSRPILSTVKVTENSLTCTNLETYIQFNDNFGLIPGCHKLDTIGLIGPTSDKDYPLVDFNHNVLEEINVNLDDLFYCNKFSSNDKTRIYLNSVAFDDGYMVAVNNHILKAFETKKLNQTYLIPRVSLNVLEGLTKLFKINGDIQIQFSESFATIKTDFFTFQARLINRDFAKWKTVIPTSYKYEMSLNKLPELKTIKSALNRNNGIKLESINGKVVLKVCETDLIFPVGDSNIDHDFTIGFNLKYLETCMRNKDKSLKIKINGNVQPCEVNGAIVMPLKV